MSRHHTLFQMSRHEALFAEHRQLLFGVAYRLLGRVAEAEDVVQDAWLRWASVDLDGVQDPRAFLVRIASRLALDRLRRLKASREAYIGPWLPEPLLTAPDVADEVERAESLAVALLVVLETLSPLERAVFVLREAFGFSHPEIAEILGRSEAAVRQLASRARTHVQSRRPRFEADPQVRRRVTERFLAACASGQLTPLMQVLAPEVTLVADGGGRVLAPRQPLHGADLVARFLVGILRPEALARYLGLAPGQQPPAVRAQVTDINGGPGLLIFAGERPIAVVVVDVLGDQVQTVRLVANPDKLARLAPQPSPA